MTKQEVQDFEDEMLSNIDQLESEFCCNDKDANAFEARRLDVKSFCFWARTKAT